MGAGRADAMSGDAKGCCGYEGVTARVWQGVLREMGSRRTCYCDWEKERWRERGKGEQERRPRATKTGERNREGELRCVRWRILDLEWVGSGDMRMGERNKYWELEIERDKAWVFEIERDKEISAGKERDVRLGWATGEDVRLG